MLPALVSLILGDHNLRFSILQSKLKLNSNISPHPPLPRFSSYILLTLPYNILPWISQLPIPLLGEGNGNPLQYTCLGIPWTGEPEGLYIPWGHKELDTTKWLTHITHTFPCLSCTLDLEWPEGQIMVFMEAQQ